MRRANGYFSSVIVLALVAVAARRADAQPKPPQPPASAQPPAPAQPPPPLPPGTGTDLELDPDAPTAPPAPPVEEKKEEPPPLPPVGEHAWGVGGKEQEGKYVPTGKTGALKEDEADSDDGVAAPLGSPGYVGLDTVIGFGEIRVPTNDLDRTPVTVASFLVNLRYRFGELWTVGVRMPFSRGSAEGPMDGNSDDFDTAAVGNLNIAMGLTFPITRRIRLPVGLGFYAPLASGDLFAETAERGNVAQAIVNQAASASRGWEESALFASKRAAFAPKVGVAFDSGAIHAALSTKLEIMLKAGGNDPTPEQGALHDPSTNWVTNLSFHYGFLDGMVTPGLRFWLAVQTAPVTVGVSKDYSGAQAMLEPEILGRFPLNPPGNLAVSGGIGYLQPLGGHLGGGDSASIRGLRIKAALEF